MYREPTRSCLVRWIQLPLQVRYGTSRQYKPRCTFQYLARFWFLLAKSLQKVAFVIFEKNLEEILNCSSRNKFSKNNVQTLGHKWDQQCIPSQPQAACRKLQSMQSERQCSTSVLVQGLLEASEPCRGRLSLAACTHCLQRAPALPRQSNCVK